MLCTSWTVACPTHLLPPLTSLPASSCARYEEEDEFDALTDAMAAKDVVLVAAPEASADGGGSGGAGVEALRAYLAPLKFAQAFSSEQVRRWASLLHELLAPAGSIFTRQPCASPSLPCTTAHHPLRPSRVAMQALPFAQAVWAGRDAAPYFLKVRARAGLDAAAGSADAEAAAAAAGGVWEELLQQNWRVELDAGLGTVGPRSEALLLVAAPAAVAQLLAAAGAAPDGGVAAGSVSVLLVGSTQAGDPLEWRTLAKRLALEGATPAAGETIEAVLQQDQAVH